MSNNTSEGLLLNFLGKGSSFFRRVLSMMKSMLFLFRAFSFFRMRKNRVFITQIVMNTRSNVWKISVSSTSGLRAVASTKPFRLVTANPLRLLLSAPFYPVKVYIACLRISLKRCFEIYSSTTIVIDLFLPANVVIR